MLVPELRTGNDLFPKAESLWEIGNMLYGGSTVLAYDTLCQKRAHAAPNVLSTCATNTCQRELLMPNIVAKPQLSSHVVGPQNHRGRMVL